MPHAPCPLEHRCHTSPSQAPRQARAQAVVVLLPMPTGGPVYAPGCGVGRGPRPACGAVVVAPGSGSSVAGGVRWPALAPTRLPGSSMASPAPGTRARRGRGHRVLRQSMPASPVRCRGMLRGPVAAVGAAGSAVPQQRQACSKGASRGRAVVPGTVGRAPSTPVPGAASAAITHGPLDVAASGGPGGAHVGGGGRSPGSPGTRVGSQQPNKGLQATANSLRSCVAPATRRA